MQGEEANLGQVGRCLTTPFRPCLIQLQKCRNAFIHGFGHGGLDVVLVSDLIETVRNYSDMLAD